MIRDSKYKNDLESGQVAVDKKYFLDLLDEEKQNKAEEGFLSYVLSKIRLEKIGTLENEIKLFSDMIAERESKRPFDAEDYRAVLSLKEKIIEREDKLLQFEKQFNEPYFARMDLYDAAEKYFQLYIGKKGDRTLGIMDWRAPLSKKYYQKSSLQFSYNEYSYKVILRRAYRIEQQKLTAWKNEYLNLRDFLTKEEIAGRDESLVFDPFLKEILAKKKERAEMTDIIETIQEKQYEIITLPEKDNVIVQGCAGSGKTMILLHRLSYLMYNNADIKPEHILVLTPSVSFNDFIDELCNILEIDKVKTDTIYSYYAAVLKARGVQIEKNIDYSIKEPTEYLKYIYSGEFAEYAKRELDSIIGGFKDFFTCEEFLAIRDEVLSESARQSEEFKKLKNAPKYIIKTVLGEIKISKEQNIYYTRQFRRLMSEYEVISTFLQSDFSDVRFDNKYYFFTRYKEFFDSLKFISKNLSSVQEETLAEIKAAEDELNKQYGSLITYKTGTGANERLLFPDKIVAVKKMLDDYGKARTWTENIFSAFGGMADLITVIKSSQVFVHSGNADKDWGLAKFLYSEVVKKIKSRYKLKPSKFYKSDLYTLTQLLYLFDLPLKLGHSYVFIDEGQDISGEEFKLIRSINDTAAINVFGDTAQNISSYRGIRDWAECGVDTDIRYLEQNYRNTNQIVAFVKEKVDISMQAIGFDGKEVEYIQSSEIERTFFEKSGLKAVIGDEDSLLKIYKSAPAKYSVTGGGRISKNKINLLTVSESKGLEFSTVAVIDKNLTDNEKYIAYTRALKELYIAK